MLRPYSDTEGVGLQFVEVCVQIVLGTIDKNGAAVNLWTVSQTATGKYYTVFIVMHTLVASSPGHLVHIHAVEPLCTDTTLNKDTSLIRTLSWVPAR